MKKKFALIFIFLAVITVFSGCKKDSGSSNDQNFDNDTSYALGLSIGDELKNTMNMSGIAPNMDEFLNGFRDGITDAKPRFDLDQAGILLDRIYSSMREEAATGAMQSENEFLAENAKRPGIKITSSGLQYEVITEGTGPKPSLNSTVQVHYTGKFTDGTVFDSSYDYQTPVEFALYQVIPGWTEGLQLMSVGSVYDFYIPSELGYGPGGSGRIPPYSVLVFTIELIDIK